MKDMIQRLERALKVLTARRDVLLRDYISALERSDWDSGTLMHATETGKRLENCDWNLAKVKSELNRLDPIAGASLGDTIFAALEVSNAS